MDLDIYLVRLNSSAENHFYLERILPSWSIVVFGIQSLNYETRVNAVIWYKTAHTMTTGM